MRAADGGRVTYAGHLDRPSLQRLYADSDVLILPSHSDVWGLVINEALEHGLAVIATRAVGAVDDLVLDDMNGYVTETGDVGELAKAMTQIAAWDEAKWSAAATTSAETAERWSIDAAAAAFVAACHAGAERIITS